MEKSVVHYAVHAVRSNNNVGHHTSAVLRQPLDFFLSILPAYAEPKEVTTTDEILGWLFYALNSILWGGIIYFAWYGFRYRFHRQEAA